MRDPPHLNLSRFVQKRPRPFTASRFARRSEPPWPRSENVIRLQMLRIR